MSGRSGRVVGRIAAAVVVVLAGGGAARAGTPPTNFAEWGTTVNGFQDSFGGTSLDPGWVAIGTNVYSVSDGWLHVAAPSSDPTKLLYEGASYDGTTQNVLALIKVTSATATDSRVGVSAGNTTIGYGINLMFRGNETLDNVAWLNDYVAHGPQNSFAWQVGTSYWVRMLHSPNKTGGADPAFNGSNDCFGKVWLADGTTPEPADYQFAWASNDSRSGFAGIQSGAPYGSSQFDVGYVLIQAAGLPSISVGPTVAPTPPEAPINLSASYTSGAGVSLSWTDQSADETGFQVERAAGAFPFSLLTTKNADETTHADTLLYPSVTYTYRVRSFNANGPSTYSNEASITTSAAEVAPAAPNAPSGLTASPLGTRSVALAWRDNSSDEIGFEIARAEGALAYASLVGVKPDVVSFPDHSAHPGWPCAYRVRALSVRGASAFSDPTPYAVPATLDIAVLSGTVTDSTRFAKDALKLKASYAFLSGDATAALDPVASGMALQVGATSAPVVVSIPAADKGWKVKTQRKVPVAATWKSAKGVAPKVAVTVDLVRKTLTVAVTGAQFLVAPTTNVRTLVAAGFEGGAQSGTWTEKKPGYLRFP
jgi:hypothetical protein